jgi:hypothetical protein
VNNQKRRFVFILSIAALIILSSCSTINHLEDYEIRGSNIAMDMMFPPQPSVNVDYGDVNFSEDRLLALFKLGTNIVKAGEARKAELKLRSALQGLYIPEYAAELTFDRIVKMLDSTMIEDINKADLILEIDIQEYGIEADSFNGDVSMVFTMIARFYHPGDNKIIWQRHTRVERRITPGFFAFDELLGNVVSIASLANLNKEQLADGFKALTYEIMEETINDLRKDIRRSRKR